MRSEDSYNRLAGYGLARRYAAGKAVADVDPQRTGYGAHVLAGAAGSVTCLFDASEALDEAPTIAPEPNVTYEAANLPELPFADSSLDVVIALEVMADLTRPGDFVAEAKRVLKDEGVLVVSAPDKQAFSSRTGRGFHAEELRDLLEPRLGFVKLYRQGAVSGAVISGGDDLYGLAAESLPFAAPRRGFGDGLPDTDLILAVCRDAELPTEDEGPYLVLDRDRRLLDECENAREDVELLKAEIRHMEKTEVQAFRDATDSHAREMEDLREDLRARVAEAQRLRQRLDDIEGSRTYRLLCVYRRLRLGLRSLVSSRRSR